MIEEKEVENLTNQEVDEVLKRFTGKIYNYHIEFHKDHPYEIVECGYGLHHGRTVNEDGTLGYRKDNIYANMGIFAGCKTVQEMRDRILQALNAYRDM